MPLIVVLLLLLVGSLLLHLGIATLGILPLAVTATVLRLCREPEH